MINNNLSIYESWNLEQPIIPSHSRLYKLEPIGIGTPYVEGLTSYITRLAESHSVETSKLMAQELAPLINATKSVTLVSNASKGVLNGNGHLTARIVNVLEELTLLNNLSCLTFLTWKNVLFLEGCFRSFRAWCPVCYEEWDKENQVYEPLIWSLNLIKVCTRHSQFLKNQCPHCSQKLPRLAWYSRPGYCSKCKGWLGNSPEVDIHTSNSLSEDELKQQFWLMNNIGELIATTPILITVPSKEILRKNILTCMNQFSNGNKAKFACFLGIDVTSLDGWLKRGSLPRLINTLNICCKLKIRLISFLTKDISLEFPLQVTEYDPEKLNSSIVHKKNQEFRKSKPIKNNNSTSINSSSKKHQMTPRKYDLSFIKQTLEAALQEYPPPSISEIIKCVGASNGALYNHFPSLCHAIAARHRTEKRKAIQYFLEAVLNSDEFPLPSLKEVASRLGHTARTLRAYFPAICYTISSRHRDDSKKVIQLSLEEVLNNVQYSTISMKELANKLGVCQNYLWTNFPDISSVISARYASYRDAEIAKKQEEIILSIEALLNDNNFPLSLEEVARKLNLSPSFIYRNFPELASSIVIKYSNYRKASSIEYKKNVMEEIKQAVLELHTKGINPSSYYVEQMLPKPGVMRASYAMASLYEIRRELGYEN
ncbi:TniQ family protein [Calothrix sp. NIES-2098]|uniref:TniQ family protein n=1 Tax=Calothrix sp. NIES-2098 TaxID=1954171 RepID=UPI000B5E075D|nr:TetR family transcriptional regulator [Calothrix sp. NIES-2098]